MYVADYFINLFARDPVCAKVRADDGKLRDELNRATLTVGVNKGQRRGRIALEGVVIWKRRIYVKILGEYLRSRYNYCKPSHIPPGLIY